MSEWISVSIISGVSFPVAIESGLPCLSEALDVSLKCLGALMVTLPVPNRTLHEIPAMVVLRPTLTFQGCIVSHSSKAAGSLSAGPRVPSLPSPRPPPSARSARALAAPSRSVERRRS